MIHNVRNIRDIRTLKNQKGVTLLELLLALAVIVIVIGVGIVIYNQTTSSAASYSSTSSVMNVTAGVKSIYTRPDYFGLTTSILVNSGKAPSNMVSGTTLLGQWGGAVDVAPQTLSATGAAACAAAPCNTFQISYAGVPRDACTSLVSGMLENFDAIYVGTTLVKNRLSATPSVANPNVGAVTTACASSATSTLRFVSV